MKKLISFLLVLALLLPSVPAYAATGQVKVTIGGKTAAKDRVDVAINDKKLSLTGTPAYLDSGYAMVPYKAVFANKTVGVKTTYTAKTKKLVFKYGTHTISMTVGSKDAVVDKVKETMPMAPVSVIYPGSKKSCIVVPAKYLSMSLGLSYIWDTTTKTVKLTCKDASAATKTKSLSLEYDGKSQTYKGKQLAITVGKTKIKSDLPGIILNKIVMIPAKEAFQTSAVKATLTKKGSIVTLKKGKNVVQLVTGKNSAYVNGVKKTMAGKTYLITNKKTKKTSIMVPAEFITKALGYTYTYSASKNSITIKSKGSSATEKPSDPVTPPEEDPVKTAKDSNELRGMWITASEFGTKAVSEKAFQKMVDTMFDKTVDYGMNAVIVQVREYSYALYPSKIYSWSKYLSGKAGKALTYDPVSYMVSAAHKRNLKFYAWIDPGRVGKYTNLKQPTSVLPKGNKAKTWYESKDLDKQRNVLVYEGMLYFNPSTEDVQKMVEDGIKELLEYDIDGIQLDDSFYPEFGRANVSSAFDAKEYNTYKKNITNIKDLMSIAEWRRSNVNNIMQDLYLDVKTKNKEMRIGICVGGDIDGVRSSYKSYLDVDKWMRNKGYVDYIVPRLYYSFGDAAPFDTMLDAWIAAASPEIVDILPVIPVYKAGTTAGEWASQNDILKRQVTYSRSQKVISGFMFNKYSAFSKDSTKKEVNNLLTLFK